ncbi:TPA: small membrane protein [Klebsiella pneumoniae]|nr:small membrane protein [Klebsiella pneumoniae]HBT1944495.1 small membrane protein [Klebsiella pneumoniae]
MVYVGSYSLYVAVALLGVAIYSLVSYLKERRASQLPVHKKKK